MSTRKAEIAAPLDYSFLDINDVIDLRDEIPRGGARMPDASHDKHGNHISPEEQEDNRQKLEESRKEMEATLLAQLAQEQFMITPMEATKRTHVAKPRRKTTILKLNNNALLMLNNFLPILTELLYDPFALTMLDLSFNQFKKIPDEIKELQNLTVLYLHGNCIKSLSDMEKIYDLPSLKGLTSHGNPIEDSVGYRQYVIAACPQLSSLDFNRITKNERAESMIVVNRHGALKKSLAKRTAAHQKMHM